MKSVTLTLKHDNFFCPFSGQKILGPETYNRSPALIGLWQFDNILEPDIHDIELLAEWESFRNERGHFQIEEFFAAVQKEEWIAFLLTNESKGCRESTTIALVINGNYVA